PPGEPTSGCSRASDSAQKLQRRRAACRPLPPPRPSHGRNADVSGGIDDAGNPFWVDGSLRVSADEQVEFLRRLHDGRRFASYGGRLACRVTFLPNTSIQEC